MTRTETTTLTDFLLARIAEDEAVARAARPGGRWKVQAESGDGHGIISLDEHAYLLPDYPAHVLDDEGGAIGPEVPTMEHIARHDPARVLVECDAKRRIVELARGADEMDSGNYAFGSQHALDEVLRLLALPYADHPDYLEEWKP